MKKPFKMDIPLLIAVIVLVLFGIVMVFSSSAPYSDIRYGSSTYFFSRQWKFAAVGLLFMLILSRIDYHIYKKVAIPFFVFCIVLCLLVFTPIGLKLNNARRWLLIRIGGSSLTLMPSDPMKIGCVIMMATLLERRDPKMNSSLKGIIQVLLVVGLTVLPIYFQPNYSTVLILIATLFLMYIVAGMNFKFVIPLIPIAVIFLYFTLSGEKNAYRLERIFSYLNPLEDKQDSGWQLIQSLYAISSGGFLGVGLGKSSQKFAYLSEAHNDFIYAIICEELGFIGAIAVIFLFLFFISRGVNIAYRAKDRFGTYLAVGITAVIGLQAVINMAVTLGLIPTTGITLPFISYGGTSLVILMGMTGILLNISRFSHRRNSR